MTTIDAIYEAVAHAETGGEASPWIRTRIRPPAGSTAYGPVQLTALKAGDYMDRYFHVLSPFLNFFAVFAAQGHKFRRWGGALDIPPDFRKYDYGGVGDICASEQDKRDYVRFCKAIMQIDLCAVDYNLGRFIEKWRGVPESEDPGYFAKVRNHFYQEV